MKKTYAELLRDPRWQKKRLEIMQRDNFSCVICSSKDKTLHVHHCFYKKGADPWDYPNDSLVTLCFDCHEEEGAKANEAKSELIQILSCVGCLSEDFRALTESIALSTLSGRDIIKKWIESTSDFEIGGKNG